MQRLADHSWRDAWFWFFVPVRNLGLPELCSLKTLAYNDRLIILKWNHMWRVFFVTYGLLFWLKFYSCHSGTSSEGMLAAALHLIVDRVMIVQKQIGHDGGQIRDGCATLGGFHRQRSRAVNWCVACSADLNGEASEFSAWTRAFIKRIPHCITKTCFCWGVQEWINDWRFLFHACL